VNTVLLANLIKIRWLAIAGQIFALVTVQLFFDFSIPITECLVVVFLSVFVNIFSSFIQKTNPTLDYKKTFLFLLFDITQLVALIYLTGGIFNPFIILIIAPIIISASYLPALWTIILSLYSILLILFINYNFISLDWKEDFITPNLYKIGILIAIIITIIFIAIYAYLFASSSRKISEALSETKLKLSNQKKTTEVAYLSAAAVHELSTPLNTIFLVLNDFIKDRIFTNNTELMKDVKLLKSQAERCKDILLRLSKNPQNLTDNFFEKIRLVDLIKLNFEKFNDNKQLEIIFDNFNEENQILFKDEINYALGNIIQNAIIYSRYKVTTIFYSNNEDIIIKIKDDGHGFSKEVLDKLGEPYISINKKGMGLGIFIAKNLIENMKGGIFFYNTKQGNAVVEIKFKKVILLQ